MSVGVTLAPKAGETVRVTTLSSTDTAVTVVPDGLVIVKSDADTVEASRSWENVTSIVFCVITSAESIKSVISVLTESVIEIESDSIKV